MVESTSENSENIEAENAVVLQKERLSIIWLLPIIALLIGLGLAYQHFANQPIDITVHFPSGEGLVVGKTEVKYEGIVIGTVKDIKLEPTLKGVYTRIEMVNRIEIFLTSGTQFWLVKPQVSFAGVTGLGTLLKGNYIGVKIADGDPVREYWALEEPPQLDDATPGLHITLKADELGSLHVGSPVSYKKIKIGTVQQYKLNEKGNGVDIQIHINEDYQHLVNSSSRFWNSSGLRIEGGLSGVKLEIDSLASLVAGGISLHTVEEAKAVEDEAEFKLYKNFDAAEAGITINIRFQPDGRFPEEGTKVRFRGFDFGIVKKIRLNEDINSVTAEVLMDPRTEAALNTGTRFWLVKPSLSLSGFEGVDALVGGNYIEVDRGVGIATTEFVAMTHPPRHDFSLPGLHLKLRTQDLASIGRGTAILFRNIKVGYVEGYELAGDGTSITAFIHIEKEYVHLINAKTRFWNASGIDVKGGLGGFKFRMTSLANLVRGGIEFSSPMTKISTSNSTLKKIVNGHSYRLYEGYDDAHESGIPITLRFKTGDGLKEDTPIKYQGIEVGHVKSVQLTPKMDGVIVKATLNEDAGRLAKEQSKFWIVKPKLGLAGTANLETLVTGQYITVEPGGGKSKYQFTALNAPPSVKQQVSGLNVVLTSSGRGSVKNGATVAYRGMQVGSVTGVELADESDHVRIHVNIEQAYTALVRKNSKFWNASGVDLNFKLFGGASVKTDSLQSILEGGIAFATPDVAPLGERASNGKQYRLHNKVDQTWLDWRPKIPRSR